jgi:hypothetical protein
MTVRDLRADQDIVRDQDRPSQCCLILDGFACRYKVMLGGKRRKCAGLRRFARGRSGQCRQDSRRAQLGKSRTRNRSGGLTALAWWSPSQLS